MRSRSLSIGHRLTLLTLILHTDWGGRVAWVTHSWLAGELGVQKDTIAKHVRELRAAGLVGPSVKRRTPEGFTQYGVPILLDEDENPSGVPMLDDLASTGRAGARPSWMDTVLGGPKWR